MDALKRLFCTLVICFLWTSHWLFLGASEDCLSPLGMEDRRIKDDQLKATSSRKEAGPKYARLNQTGGYGGWCPLNKTSNVNDTGQIYSQFIQVNLDMPVRIKAISMQGREGGAEKVEQYWINYTPNRKVARSWKWIYHESGLVQYFKGNKDSLLQRSMLKPPIIADGIRLAPLFYANTLVCMRFELLGCQVKNGLVAYAMPQGSTMGARYNFTDSIYDGLTKNSFLSSGLGFLTDGRPALADFVDGNGLGWIGWDAKNTPAPYIVFKFLDTRIFYHVTIHCNVRDQASVKLFSKLEVSFSEDGVTFHASVTKRPKAVTSGTSWINRNVTIDLCRNTGKSVQLNFSFAGDWILISEVTFESVPLGSKSPPDVFCTPVVIPPTLTVPSKVQSLTTTTSPSHGTTLAVQRNGESDSSSIDGGVIAGIIFGALAVLVIVVLFICWWRFPYWLPVLHRDKPFNYFIKVEMQPAASPQRVERNASAYEQKKNNQRHDSHNGSGVRHADVTACPIYASVGEKLDVPKPETHVYVNNTHKFHRLGSDVKPLKKVKPPVAPALEIEQSVPEVVYAEPDTPLLSTSTPSPSPTSKPPVSPLNLQVDFSADISDNEYAEPDTPVDKNLSIVTSPSKPRVVSGYADPIDAVSPPPENTFRNPIYEDLYSHPYQGVSGTSLYCNPSEDLNMRPRQSSFKDFPRQKLSFREKIGDGQFGEVYIGEAECLDKIVGDEFRNIKRTTVAIKILKLDVDKNIKHEFFKEVKAMAGLRHINVVRLLGVCQDDPMCMIVEYMANGDLNQFLKQRELKPDVDPNRRKGGQSEKQYVASQALLYIATQVAAGMKYISSLNYVHRDLATRNCLVGHAYTVKIADFGMSRHLYSKHYYRVEGRVILPIRWMAPECILQGRFTTASDVWAYGVTLWEILTLAREHPYSDITDEEVISKMQALFHRPDSAFTALPQPETCPDDLYQLMLRCWRKELEERPSFTELHSDLAERVRLSEVEV